jgi:hypothetical protein
MELGWYKRYKYWKNEESLLFNDEGKFVPFFWLIHKSALLQRIFVGTP